MNDDCCPFCEGSEAARAGIPPDRNPYPLPSVRKWEDFDTYVTSDWYLWDTGWTLAKHPPSRIR